MNLNNITYEKLKPDDLPVLQRIALQTFIDAFAKQNNPEFFSAYLDTAFSREKLTAELTNENSTFYFVKNGAFPYGFGFI